MQKVIDFLAEWGGKEKHELQVDFSYAWDIKKYWTLFNFDWLGNHLVQKGTLKKKYPIDDLYDPAAHELECMAAEEIAAIPELPIEDRLELNRMKSVSFFIENYKEILTSGDINKWPSNFSTWESEIKLYEHLYVTIMFFEYLMFFLPPVSTKLYFHMDAELSQCLAFSYVKLSMIEGEDNYKKVFNDSKKKGMEKKESERTEAAIEAIKNFPKKNPEQIAKIWMKNWEANGKEGPEPYAKSKMYEIKKKYRL